ncbi:hypothetical protein J6590_091069 [Homalodisca vitripennis]|nr:hypothetical protein J6590_091069 [Homalodisca vitripennis]
MLVRNGVENPRRTARATKICELVSSRPEGGTYQMNNNLPKGSLTIIPSPRPRTLTSTVHYTRSLHSDSPYNRRSQPANLAGNILPEPVQKNSGW